MHITGLRIVGLRSFEDTKLIELCPKVNIFIGQNNAGKSTLLKVPMAFQGYPFTPQDFRTGSTQHNLQMLVQDVPTSVSMAQRPNGSNFDIVRDYSGPAVPTPAGYVPIRVGSDQPLFSNSRPENAFEIFLARRKAMNFDQSVNANSTNLVSGNLSNLYARINHLDASGHPNHSEYIEAVREIVGVPITMRAAANGQEAGFYMDPDHFVSLERMGDGVSEMMSLIVELSLARNKIFVMEEPETNLHPKGLKALMGMVRKASERNQFLIATHSNIVVRELGSEESTKVFQVFREDENYKKPSIVREVPPDPFAHTAVLRDLGYEFGDMQLHDGWLFLEEASAESVVEKILVPLFIPQILGKVRTFSAGGATKLSECVAEFQRLITYVHLEPAYRGRLWVWADGDETGRKAIEAIRATFNQLDAEHCGTLVKEQFEFYFPAQFQNKVKAILAIPEKKQRRVEKLALLKEVLAWSKDAPVADVSAAWADSAKEVIDLLSKISAAI